uniref:Calcineurin-like phosphoesterase domain-containing protein n=1 Tax=Corethron hystrix TaxID=216773 RepID=A0A7S1BKU4_9STRA|mmetsp:Transcript_32275/g.74315  ORF Transcript_32275/g.74315 Transcript_32275/m.74315 type:complete len:402 (+) Transcript_32275:135-1340(+)
MVFYFSLISLTWWLSFHRFASSLKIAFVGDTGVEDPKHDGFGHRTMKMIEKEGVNLVINVGDFEYWGRCHERYEVTTEKMFFEAKDGKSYSLAEKEQLGRYQWLLGTREPFSGWQIGFENAGTEETLAAVSHETWKGMERNLRLTSEEKCNGGPWDGPWEWRQFVRNYNFDFLAASGNHEVSGDSGGGSEIWADHQKYMWNLYNERIFETGRGSCRGYHNRTEPGTVQEYGERYSCIYNDQHILFLGWHQGSDHSPKSSSEKRREKSIKFIEREFSRHDEAANNVRWRYCVHHMTASKLSPGPKKDNMRLFGIVDACRKHGALIISGHYHIYGRTKMLKSVGSDELYPIVSDDENQNKVMENQTMSIVVGNGGYTGRCDGINEGSSWMEICLAGEKYRGWV